MPAPFAALEARTAAAVLRHTANAQATATTRFSEVVQFQVIFDGPFAQALGDLMAGNQPQALARTADVADLDTGCAITINGVDYLVAGPIQPDGTGMSRLILELSV